MATPNYPPPAQLKPKQLSTHIADIESRIKRVRREIIDEFIHVMDGETNATPAANDKSPAANDKSPAQPSDADNKDDSSNPAAQTSTKQQPNGKKAQGDCDAQDDCDSSDIWQPPRLSIPIRADVRNFDFKRLAEMQVKLTGRKFDVIMTDPPWQLATSNPTRGVAIGYQQLGDSIISDIPFPELQDNGFLFIWVINAKYRFALNLMEQWGYTLVDEVVWVKQTVNRRLAKSHGFYLQHAKETCLVGRKGSDPVGTVGNAITDTIFAERRGQSQKPVEIYEMIEKFVPNGSYLEIFGRRNNLRDNWVTVGNEL